jgi:hypothetical protein
MKYWLLILLFFGLQAYSQHSISKYEYRWALWHPFAALKIKKQLPKALAIYKSIEQQKKLDTLTFGGKLDAFRHSFTMAYLARSIKTKKLRKLGIAHEKGNKRGFYKNQLELTERADSLACEMDLRNNELGFLIGSVNKKVTDEVLKQLILSEIKNGEAWYLKRNKKNEYLTCDNQIIHLLDYKGIWSVPKCLIKTDE